MPATDRLFDPKLAFLAILAIAVSQYAVFVMALAGASPDFTFGGDFAAFWVAAKASLNGTISELYDAERFKDAIQAQSPHQDLEGLTWQYPPHAGLLFGPLGALPFHIAYAVWCVVGLVFYAAAAHAAGFKDRLLIVLLASVPVLLALKTGQVALLMGGLLLLAVFHARSRPILAGLAAGLLTVKPQLGFLLPVLFIVGGHWRAFYAATGVGVGLVFLSGAVLGLEAWTAFFDSVLAVSGAVATGEMPLFKMVNIYAAAQLMGIPDAIAVSIAFAAILLAIGATTWVVCRTEDPEWHYAAIACLTLIAAPYSYYYELILVVPALLLVLKRGYAEGWLRFEREGIALIALLCLALPGLPIRAGVSINFLLMLLIGLVVYRRLIAELAAKSPAALHPA
jgi:alpha-1,2-mannosyltransferase